MSRTPLIALLFALLAAPTPAAEPVGKRWPEAERVPIDRIDHAPLTALLAKYVDDDGYVNYRGWKADAGDRRALLDYLASLGRADARAKTAAEAKLAFWINAYNALTIEGILREYPTDSIRDHTAALFGYNLWKDLPLVVGADEYSLDTIEHQILRKLGDPRIHFAIVCASVGCPRLRDEAYTAQKLDEQLTENAKHFFAQPQNLRVDRENRTLYLSSILKWFGEDFGETPEARLKRIAPWLPGAAREFVSSGPLELGYLNYDWGLNDQATKGG